MFFISFIKDGLFLGSSSAHVNVNSYTRASGEDPARSYTKTQFRNEVGFSPSIARSLPLSYFRQILHTPHLRIPAACNNYNLDYILNRFTNVCFFLKFVENRFEKNKARIRNVVTTIGMATGCQCMSPLNYSTAQHGTASRARLLKNISSRSSLGDGYIFAASCRRNGNGCCCQGDSPSFRSQGHAYYHAAASHATCAD